jgi:pyruvate dehydrogenase E1 component alpha subunit
MDAVLGEIMGRTTGAVGGVGGSMHLCDRTVGLLPTSAIVGAGIPIAVGAALTASMFGNGTVALALFGDGATNIGAFHEGLNLAAIWRLPVVFVCENNVYGEYSRFDRTTPIEDLAERGRSYAIPSEVVDGQSLDAVVGALELAVDRARSGGGPTFLECKTYRYSGHSRADAATYRPEGELDRWLARDPLVLYAQQLVGLGILDDAKVAALRGDVDRRVDECVERIKAAQPAMLESMFRNAGGR